MISYQSLLLSTIVLNHGYNNYVVHNQFGALFIFLHEKSLPICLYGQCWGRYFQKVTSYILLVTFRKSNSLQLHITFRKK